MDTVQEKIDQMRLDWAANDAKRDAGLTPPQGLTLCRDIPYGEQLLDVYYPAGTEGLLPTIISIHGGGWFYGDKELYADYCMRLAARGFAVVNFNYRLAPEHPYPAGLEDCCRLLHWVNEHGHQYHIDRNNLYTVGDSAGGQLSLQLLTMLTNPDYAALFPFRCPDDLTVRACALNCGFYFFPFNRLIQPKAMGVIFEAYLPGDYMRYLPQLRPARYVTQDFPPAFVVSAQNDYLKLMAGPLHRRLRRAGVESVLKIYGTKAQKEVAHVFHVNAHLPLAHQCNDEQCAFFRAHMEK